MFCDSTGRQLTLSIHNSIRVEVSSPVSKRSKCGNNDYAAPTAEITEDGSHILIRMHLPTVDIGSLDVTTSNGFLDIRPTQNRVHDVSMLYIDKRMYEGGQRCVPIPQEADPDTAVASCQDGILTVRFLKKKWQPRKLNVFDPMSSLSGDPYAAATAVNVHML
jgi:HSP20 family molecular chaperone IbpA